MFLVKLCFLRLRHGMRVYVCVGGMAEAHLLWAISQALPKSSGESLSFVMARGKGCCLYDFFSATRQFGICLGPSDGLCFCH